MTTKLKIKPNLLQFSFLNSRLKNKEKVKLHQQNVNITLQTQNLNDGQELNAFA